MRRKEDLPISKHTLNLFEGDYNRLQEMYPRLGAAKLIRELVRAHIRRIEAKLAQSAQTVPELDIDAVEEVIPDDTEQ